MGSIDHFYLALLARVKRRGGNIPQAQVFGHDRTLADRMVRLQYLTINDAIYRLTAAGSKLADQYKPIKPPSQEPLPEIIP